jgi:hypothetical protein
MEGTSDGQQAGGNPGGAGTNSRGIAGAYRRAVTAVRQAGTWVFGDRAGLALFLGAVLWLAALWRIGIFIQDTVAVASALANVGAGRLALVDIPYSLTIGPQPGVVEVGGQTFGRNYGHVLLALPVLYLLKGLSLLADPKLLLAGGWSLGLVAFAIQVERVTGRRWIATAGSAVALVVFAGNVATARTLPDGILALVALQLTTLLVAGYLAVILYRLVKRFHGGRVGLIAGAAVILATPIGFWATIPKRHVITAGAALLALYLFAVSRQRSDRRGTLARAGAYASLGLLTTVHPFEAFFLFVVLVPVDLLTAPKNTLRGLGLVGLVFVCSLLPFFLLNTLISGNPIQSPRLIGGAGSGIETSFDLPDGGGGVASGDGGAGEISDPSDGGTGSTGDPGSASGSDSGLLPGLIGFVTGIVTAVTGFVGSVAEGVAGVATGFAGFVGSVAGFVGDWGSKSFAVLSDPDRLYHTFLRSGGIPGVITGLNDYEAIELTLLESFPLLAGLAWLPVASVRQMRGRVSASRLSTPRRQTDLLAAGFTIVFVFIYLPRLPLQSQITVRYILPVVPLLVYALARCSFVHRVVQERLRWLVGSYLLTVLVGGSAVTAALAVLDPAIGEAMQFHALVGLAAAAIAALAVVSWPVHGNSRAIGAGLALTAGLTTVFLVFAKVEYFSYRLPSGNNPHVFALDLMRIAAELLPVFPV